MKLKKLFYWIIGFILSININAQSTTSYNWQNVAIGGGGFVSGVTFSPIEQNVIYSRTDVGGAYRWNEANQSWISMMDWVDASERGLLGIESLVIDPKTPGTVYMMAGTVYWNQADDGIGRSAFLRSKDYGQTWEKIYVWDNSTKYFNAHGNGMGRGNGERLAVDPANSNTMFYGTRNKGLWKSSNNGNTWAKVNSFPVDTTWNGCGVSFVAYDPSTNNGTRTTRIYVGVMRVKDNVFVSDDAGATWAVVPNRPIPQYATRLMPQRIVVRPDGSAAYITFGDGAGPHTMQWDEGWGAINDWFNRGAVYKYDVSTQNWTDISPQNLINPENDGDYTDPATYFGCYSGISIDPNNPDHMVVSSIASYRGPQFWMIDGAWADRWGDNIFVTEDGGENWVPSFQYYWLEGGMVPNAEQMDENGTPWIIGNTIHWIGSTAIDPYNPKRVMVTSGNGVFMTDNIFNYDRTYVDEWGNVDTSYIQKTVWKFAGKGIEEVVPEDVVSISNGPMVSVIADYDGFVHDDVTQSPALGRHVTSAAGSSFSLGSTTGLDYAPLGGKLAKVAKVRTVSTEYNDIPIGPVQYSTDNGVSWTVETYTSNPPTDLAGGKLALSADGSITLWMPSAGTTMYRQSGSTWTSVSGISFSGRPVGDQVNSNKFYVYNKADGYMYVSINAGVSFSKAGFAGISNYKTARAAPNKEGHVWVPIANNDGSMSGGLMRSSDGGASFTAINGVTYCEAVGFGKAASGAAYPTVFIFGKIQDILGVWRSIDEGISWARVNDDEHEYGGLANGEFVMGDMNVFGRVYMSTAGRGIVYGDPSGNTVPVIGVSVTPASTSVSIGGGQQLSAVITPSNASNQAVTWNSSNSNLATVSSSGIVTGVASGTVSITATTVDGGFIAHAQVDIASVSVVDISVNPTSATINPGETVQLSATILPVDATNKNMSWSSSDETIATVNSDGLVTAVSNGAVSIIATSEDGGFSATCSVTVNFVEVPVIGVEVSPTSVLLSVDGTATLTATVLPEYATNKNVSWSSANSSVVTVDALGNLVGVSIGNTIITVTTEDGSYTSSSIITVSDISTGSILSEYWTGITGTSVSDLTGNANYPNNPNSSEYLTSLEGPTNLADNYGTRIRGYVIPAQSGNYTFWLAGDDNCNLYLSTDASVGNASQIASVEGWTNAQEWDKYASQQSVVISLVAGQRYYIEVLHKEGSGGDNLAVAWEGPGISQAVIAGEYLLPYIEDNPENNAPVAVIWTDLTSGTSPLTVNFDASGSNDPDGDVLTFSWTFGDGSSGTGINPSHTYSTDGTFSATLTVNDGELSNQASVTITVSSEPVNNAPVAVVAATPTSGIAPLTVSFDASGSSDADGDVLTYSWTFGDGTSGTGISPSHSYITDGTYSATLTVDDGELNNQASVTITVSSEPVNNAPIAVVAATPTSGIPPLTVVFDASGSSDSDGDVLTYSWTFGDGTTGTGISPSHTYSSVGVYTVILTVSDGELSDQASINIVADEVTLPCENPISITIPFVQNGEGQYCFVTTQQIAYINSWNLNELTINGVDFTNTWSNSIPPAVNGEWVIYYDGPYGWSHFEAPQAIEFKSTPDESLSNELNVYPNPFEDKITLNFENPEQVNSILIVDQAGKTIETIEASKIDASIQIGEQLKSGMYFLKINYSESVEIISIIKK